MDFSNLDDMFGFLEKSIETSLKQETAQAVVKTMIKHVKEDVYLQYSPDTYIRDYNKGGLIDPANIKVTPEGNGQVSIENVRDNRNDDNYSRVGYRDVAEIVETGEDYSWTGSRIYKDPFPRPFTENTRKELESSNILVDSMKTGLNRVGIDARLS